MEKIRHVYIIEGTWGEVTPEMARQWCETMLSHIVRLKVVMGERAGDSLVELARVVSNVRDPSLQASLTRGDVTTTVIFNSRSNLDAARAFKKERRNRRVLILVMTGLVPDDEVVILDKAWIPDLDLGAILR